MVYKRNTRVSAYSVRKLAPQHQESKTMLKKKVPLAPLKKKEAVSKLKSSKLNMKAKQKRKAKLKSANSDKSKRRAASSSAEESKDSKKHKNKLSSDKGKYVNKPPTDKEKYEKKQSPEKEKHENKSPSGRPKRKIETTPDTEKPVQESSASTQRTKKRRYSAESEEVKSEKSEGTITNCDNVSNGEKCFKWLINPVLPETFFSTVWEKKPLLVRRHNPEYYKGLFSSSEFDKILRKKEVWFSKNIDITTYTRGVRETHNPDGRAYSDVVWDFFQDGCSVRFLNPQTYSSNIWQLNSMLQEVFGSFVGANVYLTPANSQGFAPHYDDIEAFVLQLEGKKQWKLYNPRTPEEKLPRYSSANFTQEEIGEPILTTVLEPGDLLYFPRGFIHQAKTLAEDDSLHITLSTFQRNTWGDYFAKLIPRALEIAIEEDIEFRKALPVGYMEYMGVSKLEVNKANDRANFIKKASELTTKLIQYLPMDAAADQMAKDFLHESLPPWLMPYERMCSIHRSDETVFKTKPCWVPEKRIRIIRPTAVRLVMEEAIKLYHSIENTRQYHEIDPQYLIIDEEFVIAIEALINTYPNFIAIEDLPLDTFKQKLELVTKLYERGLLVTEDTDVPIGLDCF